MSKQGKIVTALSVLVVSSLLLLTAFKPQIGNVSPASSSMTVSNWPTIADPCQSMSVAKSSVPIAISSATTAQLVAPSGSTVVYVCGYQVSMSATLAANTIKFTTGTGATCGGSSVDETGVMSSGVLTTGATTLNTGWDATVFSSASGSGVCAVTTVGTGPSINGIMSFVQQ